MMSMHGLGSTLLGLRTRRRSSGGRRIGFTMVNVVWRVLGGGYRIVAVGWDVELLLRRSGPRNSRSKRYAPSRGDKDCSGIWGPRAGHPGATPDPNETAEGFADGDWPRVRDVNNGVLRPPCQRSPVAGTLTSFPFLATFCVSHFIPQNATRNASSRSLGIPTPHVVVVNTPTHEALLRRMTWMV